MLYVGTGKNAKEFRHDETEVKLWNVKVNGEQLVYRGTEQAVMEAVTKVYYYEDWSIAPRKLLALGSAIVDLTC